MIHDADLIDVLVSRIQQATWAPEGVACDVVRVWGGDVHAERLKENGLLVQLWPQRQQHRRISRGGSWDLSLTVSIGFYFRCSAGGSISEIDQRLQAFDKLLCGDDPLGSELFDVVDVTRDSETETFCREPLIEWPIRPDTGILNRKDPSTTLANAEGYTGIVASQANMIYTRS